MRKEYKLKLSIIRGKKHIGGNIIKVEQNGNAILLDCGAMLPEPNAPTADDFNIDSVGGNVKAVFLTHHHGDHSGLIGKLPPEVKLFATKPTLDFMQAVDNYLDKPFRIGERETITLEPGKTAELCGFAVTPIAAQHSAEGAAMLVVEAGGKRLVYTGDYKTAPDYDFGNIDLLITEGTMLTRSGQKYADEAAVEAELRSLMASTKGRVFVLCSSGNVQRICSVMAAKGNRLVLQDVFLKYILETMGHEELAALYGFVLMGSCKGGDNYKRIIADYKAKNQLSATNSISAPIFKNAVVFVRASMAEMLKNLIDDGMDVSNDVLVYSQWKGYEAEDNTKALLNLFKKEQIVYLHTSGHGDKEHIAELIGAVNPKAVACVHSENAKAIAGIAPDSIKIIEEESFTL